MTRCYFDLEKILLENNPEGNYGLSIRYEVGVLHLCILRYRIIELFDWNPDLGEECLLRPIKFLESFEEAIQNAQPRFLLVHEYPDRLRLKSKILPRFTALPLTPWTFFERIPTANSLGRLLSVRGTVIRTGGLKMQEYSKEWECTRCKTKQFTFVDDHQYGIIPKPVICTGVVDEVPCKNLKFSEIISLNSMHVDYQEIKIQELTSVLEIGAVPRSILILLRHELVDTCRAGDDVIITGLLGCRFKPTLKADSSRLDGEMFLKATSIQSTASINDSMRGGIATSAADETELLNSFQKFWSKFSDSIIGRSVIVNSFCPQIHGMFLMKLATLMTIIGGCESEDHDTEIENETQNGARKSRKEGHLLLFGDPGTGKSQFLVNAARLINRSVMTTGSGSTTAGLTCAAVKDGSDWQLEAGALVMADRGICCIDEFNALRPQDRTAIHEAMEQQTLSVAKAGLVCKLNTRCSIIAACNVKGEIEEGKPISANLALASPLLSRFDLIFLLLDRKRGDSWDSELCDRLLFQSSRRGNNNKDSKSITEIWEFEQLKTYINFIRTRLNPKMSKIAELVLSKYYQLQRRSDSMRCARTTVRLLESLVRLSQSHAKLMFHSEVLLEDAMTAIILVEASLTSTQTLNVPINLHSPEMEIIDYKIWYEEAEKEMMYKLEINKANLETESSSEIDDDEGEEEEELENLLNVAAFSSADASFVASFTQL